MTDKETMAVAKKLMEKRRAPKQDLEGLRSKRAVYSNGRVGKKTSEFVK